MVPAMTLGDDGRCEDTDLTRNRVAFASGAILKTALVEVELKLRQQRMTVQDRTEGLPSVLAVDAMHDRASGGTWC